MNRNLSATDGMSTQDRAIYRAARRHYERGQLSVALVNAWPLLPLLAAAGWLGCGVWCLAPLGVALTLVCVAIGWGGGAPRHAVTPALLAGAIPALLPLYSHSCATECSVQCNDASWTSACLFACWSGGLVAGAAMGIFSARAPRATWLTHAGAAVIVLLTGSLGCWVGGVPGIVGMCAAMLASAPSARLLAARWGRLA